MSSNNIYVEKLQKIANNTKYLNWYISIIQKALNRTDSSKTFNSQKTTLIKILGYIESHHIIPKCVIRKYEKDKLNLVFLTAKEHYTCHLLLVKIFPSNSGLVKAANMMTVDSNGQRINNKKYSWIRKKLSEN